MDLSLKENTEDLFISVRSKFLRIKDTISDILELNKGLTVTYIALFEEEDGGYNITIPQFDIVTCGKDMEEAVFMARDLLKCWLSNKDNELEIPLTINSFKDRFPKEYELSMKPFNSLVPISIKLKG